MLPNKFLAVFYLYIMYCYLAIFSKVEFDEELDKISKNLLKRILIKRENLFENYTVTPKQLLNFK